MNKHEYYMDALIDKLAQLDAQTVDLEERDEVLFAEINQVATELNDRAQKLSRFLESEFI